VLAPPADPQALAQALRAAIALRGRRFNDQGSWGETAEAVLELAAA
jgi:hypothetical protein